MELDAFIRKWTASGPAERANKDAFLLELCDALGVPRPEPATGEPERDRYCFERDAVKILEGGGTSIGKIDLYKHDCFLLEAKQGCDPGSRKLGAGRRGTRSWHNRMRDAYGQARSYASRLRSPPPFLLVCDIGYCFDLYAAFDGTTDYREFPDGRRSRIFLSDLAEHRELLTAIFVAPRSLDPSRRKLKVTREIAGDVARLAQQLEERASPDTVARFLMRCLFTLFAEDVGLLPPRTFRDALATWWLPDPESFPFGVTSLWTAMRDGGYFVSGRLRRFGGALFHEPRGLRLTREELERLQEAARRDWSHVEPAIFGTLLERALSPEKRHRLGAHFTPRSYVERLVRWAVEEPLRETWRKVQLAVRQDLEEERHERARNRVGSFHAELCRVTVLDPACGTGNFLYVTLDAMKRLESEVLGLLDHLGEPRQELLALRGNTVTPDQFHGVEVERWAREIAELVLWIGYLQWQVGALGGASDVPEPVLRDYHNFECRDALLNHDGEEPVLEGDGRPRTRWDRTGYRPHPVTGEPVPDEAAAVVVSRFRNPRRASWPDADFVVGNPPFIGNKRMRAVLGDGYVNALRAAYPEVPESADYVMYWWARAAELVRQAQGEGAERRRFGLITTNSITQVFNRRVVTAALFGRPPLSLFFAVPDHPWVDSADGAAVRIAMTVAGRGPAGGDGADGVLARVLYEEPGEDGEVRVALAVRRGRIHGDLSVGPDVAGAVPLSANAGLCGQGVKVVGDGFYLGGPFARRARSPATGVPVVRRIVGARDVLAGRPGSWIVDFFGLSEAEARELHPEAFQRVLTRVKPLRDQNRRRSIRELWWRFAWERPVLRAALSGLDSYFVTPSTAKHRLFVRVPAETLWDGSLFAIASDDPFVLGVLSSRVHRAWALAAGGTLEDRPTWTNGTCFDPFPFPDPDDPAPREEVRRLARAIEEHRREVRERRPGLGLTPLYNVVEKVAAGAPLNEAEREIHDAGLATLLADLRGRLDRAVLRAYGWPEELGDHEVLEHLVRLNAERAAEEEGGRVRWLRPDLQARAAAPLPVQASLLSAGTAGAPRRRRVPRIDWPQGFPERVSLVRHLLASESGPWSLEQVAASFHRARRDHVEAVLDSLVAVGVAFRFEDEHGRHVWQAAAREVA